MKDLIQILIRKGMAAFAGYLCTKALADQATADQIANGVGAGLLILFSVIWAKAHLFSVSNYLRSPKGAENSIPVKVLSCLALWAGILFALSATTGCQTALNSNKIIAVKQRCFGLVVETTSTTANAPNVKLGFCSTVWQMIPTSTNSIYSPTYMDTFDLEQGLNPFSTAISENTGTGPVMIGTNGEASAFPPK